MRHDGMIAKGVGRRGSVARACVAFACAALMFLMACPQALALAKSNARDFHEAAVQEFVIPGLDDFFVPQGISYDDRTDAFFIGGYMVGSSADPVYLVSRATGDLQKTVYLLDVDGNPQTSHAGGILVHGDYVYIAGSTDACLYAYSYNDIVDAPDLGSVACLGPIPVGTPDDGFRASWVAAVGDTLLVGEFNFNFLPFLQVSVEPALIDREGDEYRARAVALAFGEGDDTVLGVSLEPLAFYFLPDKVQGFAFSGGMAYLSTSILIGRGRVLTFDLSEVEWVGDRTFFGRTAPAYVLGDAAWVSESVVTPMAEEIEIVDDRLYVVNESASGIFLFGRLLEAQWCYSVGLDFLTP